MRKTPEWSLLTALGFLFATGLLYPALFYSYSYIPCLYLTKGCYTPSDQLLQP